MSFLKFETAEFICESCRLPIEAKDIENCPHCREHLEEILRNEGNPDYWEDRYIKYYEPKELTLEERAKLIQQTEKALDKMNKEAAVSPLLKSQKYFTECHVMTEEEKTKKHIELHNKIFKQSYSRKALFERLDTLVFLGKSIKLALEVILILIFIQNLMLYLK